ncbi:MAG: hypothetical protein BJ554DRAFT_4815 [Olpidium bornovanus]|uniref:Uncharacterized protein n=1 Tax=Olpidium bornovanus TaxID=278681 RepID=A0A8H7ZL08_9FUNG|nr:MAG: hypothetical protein BJ554DRAFT_4815 [Olpidium bornovanus]
MVRSGPAKRLPHDETAPLRVSRRRTPAGTRRTRPAAARQTFPAPLADRGAGLRLPCLPNRAGAAPTSSGDNVLRVRALVPGGGGVNSAVHRPRRAVVSRARDETAFSSCEQEGGFGGEGPASPPAELNRAHTEQKSRCARPAHRPCRRPRNKRQSTKHRRVGSFTFPHRLREPRLSRAFPPLSCRVPVLLSGVRHARGVFSPSPFAVAPFFGFGPGWSDWWLEFFFLPVSGRGRFFFFLSRKIPPLPHSFRPRPRLRSLAARRASLPQTRRRGYSPPLPFPSLYPSVLPSFRPWSKSCAGSRSSEPALLTLLPQSAYSLCLPNLRSESGVAIGPT